MGQKQAFTDGSANDGDAALKQQSSPAPPQLLEPMCAIPAWLYRAAERVVPLVGGGLVYCTLRVLMTLPVSESTRIL